MRAATAWTDSTPVQAFEPERSSSGRSAYRKKQLEQYIDDDDDEFDEGVSVERRDGNSSSSGEGSTDNVHSEYDNAIVAWWQNMKANPERLVSSPIPEGLTIKCRVQRQKDLHIMSLDLEVGNTEVSSNRHINDFVLAARKRKHKDSSNYLITTDREKMDRSGSHFVAKVRADFTGQYFRIYDDGLRPESGVTTQSDERQELACVTYSKNILGMSGPRKLKVKLPCVNQNGTRAVGKPWLRSKKSGLWKSEHAVTFVNKAPIWNPHTQSFQLDFKGRARLASTKNFQLVHEKHTDIVVLQFGKLSKDCFTLDVQSPFSLVQAFGVALSSVERKFAVE